MIQSPAKVNLTLDVVGRRFDGYHFIESVMQAVDLADGLTLMPVSSEGTPGFDSAEDTPPTAVIQCVGNGIDADGVPTDETNLARRAVDALWEVAIAAGCSGSVGGSPATDGGKAIGDVMIRIDKHIPVAAGLGGGSANAAAALIGTNILWQLGFDMEQLAAIGVNLGADIPFCLYGGTAIARGIGEQLTPLPETPQMAGVIVTPGFAVSTADVYRLYDEWTSPPHGPANADETASRRTEAMVAALRDKDVAQVASLLHNALEPVTTRLHPEVGLLRGKLVRAGALGAVMCGSGPSVFGLAEDEEHAEAIAERMRGSNLFVTACRFLGNGSRVMEKRWRS